MISAGLGLGLGLNSPSQSIRQPRRMHHEPRAIPPSPRLGHLQHERSGFGSGLGLGFTSRRSSLGPLQFKAESVPVMEVQRRRLGMPSIGISRCECSLPGRVQIYIELQASSCLFSSLVSQHTTPRTEAYRCTWFRRGPPPLPRHSGSPLLISLHPCSDPRPSGCNGYKKS